jgi:hypothetical protein
LIGRAAGRPLTALAGGAGGCRSRPRQCSRAGRGGHCRTV